MFCNDTVGFTDSFKVPHIAVHDGGVYMNKLKNKEAVGPDNMNSIMLKLALLYAVESLIYIYNSCIQQNRFPSALKAPRIIPLPKTNDRIPATEILSDRFMSCLFCQSKPLEKHIHKPASNPLYTTSTLFSLTSVGTTHPTQC